MESSLPWQLACLNACRDITADLRGWFKRTQADQVFWNKDALAAQARCVMGLEEKGLNFKEVIPEDRRAKIVNSTVHGNETKATVRAQRNMGESAILEEIAIV